MHPAVGRRAFAVAAVAWAGSIVLAAFAASRVDGTRAADLFALAVYGLGSVVCHQRPERSLHLWAVQLPVCARCTGVYVGAAMAALSVPPFFRDRMAPGSRAAAVVALVALAPTAMTVVFEWTTGAMTSNGIRLAAGLPLGAGVASVIAAALAAPSAASGQKT